MSDTKEEKKLPAVISMKQFPIRWNKLVEEGRELLESVRPGLSKEWKFTTGMGKKMGKLVVCKKIVWINRGVILHDDEALVRSRDVIRHAVAHISVCASISRDAEPHGEEWVAWAIKLGAAPEPCHAMTCSRSLYTKRCTKGCWSVPANGKPRMGTLVCANEGCGASVEFISTVTGRVIPPLDPTNFPNCKRKRKVDKGSTSNAAPTTSVSRFEPVSKADAEQLTLTFFAKRQKVAAVVT